MRIRVKGGNAGPNLTGLIGILGDVNLSHSSFERN